MGIFPPSIEDSTRGSSPPTKTIWKSMQGPFSSSAGSDREESPVPFRGLFSWWIQHLKKKRGHDGKGRQSYEREWIVLECKRYIEHVSIIKMIHIHQMKIYLSRIKYLSYAVSLFILFIYPLLVLFIYFCTSILPSLTKPNFRHYLNLPHYLNAPPSKSVKLDLWGAIFYIVLIFLHPNRTFISVTTKRSSPCF